MHRTTTLLTEVQRDWPLLRRLRLVVSAEVPAWAAAMACSRAGLLTPGERSNCQAECPDLIAELRMLRRKWYGILTLAVLLATAVCVRVLQGPVDVWGAAIFSATMCAILLPALAFQIGITYDLVAATALQQALRVVRVGAASEQRPSGRLAKEVFAVAPVVVRRATPDHSEQDSDRRE